MKFVLGSDTSREAAERLKHAETKRQQVFRMIYECGHDGAIDDELQKALGWQLNTLHPRRVELYEAGAIVKFVDQWRNTRFARRAEIYLAKEHAMPGDQLNTYGGHEACPTCGHKAAQHVIWVPGT
jgi:hypothetical protein